MPGPMSRASIARAVLWWKHRYGMEDWDYDVVISDAAPKDIFGDHATERTIGLCATQNQRKEAVVWLHSDAAKHLPEGPIHSLFHELFHSLATDCGIEVEASSRRLEVLWNILADSALELYKGQRCTQSDAKRAGRRRLTKRRPAARRAGGR